MYTYKNRFSRLFVMLLALVMIVGTFSGCQKNDPEPSVDGLELLAMETTEPYATEETEPETSLPDVATEPTVFTEPTEAEDESTEPTEAKDKPHIHSYTTTVVAPTTSAQGYTLHTCKICGDSYKDNYKNKLTSGGSGNSGGSGSSGSTHTHSYTTSVTQPTCTKKGYTTYTCKTCGYSYKTNEVPALGHDWDDKGLDTDGWYAWQAATPDGKKPALSRRVCKRCGAEEFRNEGLAHIPGELIETVLPTCTEEGYELHKCLGGTGSDTGWVCDQILKTNIVPALGHNWGEWTVTTQPTQDKEGVETRTCSRCNEKETRKIDKLPAGHTHKYEVTETVPATCTAAGKKTYTCSCGDSYDEEIAATGHAWGEWVRTQEPTEESEGVDTRTCSKCNATETRPVDKLKPETPDFEIDTSNSVIATSEALAVINKYRAENGLAPYSAGGGEDFAKLRAAELGIKFDHVHPDGTPALVWGNPYGFACECIFGGSYEAQDAVDWWMASKWGHREAMLDPNYTFATIAKNNGNWVFLAG